MGEGCVGWVRGVRGVCEEVLMSLWCPTNPDRRRRNVAPTPGVLGVCFAVCTFENGVNAWHAPGRQDSPLPRTTASDLAHTRATVRENAKFR